jgi:hypothetical protein
LRSDDARNTSLRIHDDQHHFGFCGGITSGRSIVYGEPK